MIKKFSFLLDNNIYINVTLSTRKAILCVDVKRLDKIRSKVSSRALLHSIYFDKKKSKIERLQIHIIFIILINHIFPVGIYYTARFEVSSMKQDYVLHEKFLVKIIYHWFFLDKHFEYQRWIYKDLTYTTDLFYRT